MEMSVFTIKLTYFKTSGKYYTSATFSRKFRTCLNDTETPYMNDVASHVRGLRDSGGQDAMPGLSGEGWEGYILIECDEGFPVLILPKN
jgi:hypothetical protein